MGQKPEKEIKTAKNETYNYIVSRQKAYENSRVDGIPVSRGC